MKSKSIVFTGPSRVEIREDEVGDPVLNEFQVQTLVTHVSTGTESCCFRGEFEPGTTWADWVHYPFAVGYSNVGRVTKVGKLVVNFKEGDRVFTGMSHRQSFNLTDGLKVPDYVSDEDASWSGLAVTTQKAVRQVKHGMGDVGVVIGLGPLGQLVTQYLRVLGLREILIITRSKIRVDLAMTHGATRAFCGPAADAFSFVSGHTGDELADVVYDVTGNPGVLASALKLARRDGTVMLLGDTPTPSKQYITQDVVARQVRILGAHGPLPPEYVRWTFARQSQLFHEYLRRGQMQVADLVTHRVRPEDAPTLYTMLQENRGSTVGVLFDWRE